eukprot:2234970-Rhodomonas_salina.1
MQGSPTSGTKGGIPVLDFAVAVKTKDKKPQLWYRLHWKGGLVSLISQWCLNSQRGRRTELVVGALDLLGSARRLQLQDLEARG